jgi:hypothetical protein
MDTIAKHGEVLTPRAFVDRMLDLLPPESFSEPDATWLDPGAGKGEFSQALFDRLDDGLAPIIKDAALRHRHIIKNMIFMVEIQAINVTELRTRFGENANVVHADFLKWAPPHKFQYVIGNPPYNLNGAKKVPTNTFQKKSSDGETAWIGFVKHAISLLVEGGGLLFVVPSLWMRPDKAKMYHALTKYKIHKIVCLNASETKQVFQGNAQTPTCFFYLSKRASDGLVLLGETPFKVGRGTPLPVFGAEFIKRLLPYVAHYGSIIVKKTNMPRKNSAFSSEPTALHVYPNIRTATLSGLSPRLVVNYSTTPQAHHGVPKVVLPHKMHGFPFLDREGRYGISNRDNYVIIDYPLEALELFCEFLSTKTALYLFECTRYRMRYLEKEAFQFVPDLVKIPDLPRPLTDVSLAAYFGYPLQPINALHRKEYTFRYE